MTSSHVIVGSRRRELWVDNLRVAVIAGVVVVHVATAYIVDIAGWYYDDERTSSQVWSTLLALPALIGAVFALGPLFLVAGWFSARSMASRGPGAFARSRLVRLGVPLLACVLVVNPCTDYLGNLRKEDRAFASYVATTDLGVLWFVAALLTFSLAYAGLRRLGVRPAAPGPLRAGVLTAAALTITVSSFAVWQVWPLTAEPLLNPRLGEWPQGAVLFTLGVLGAEAGWLDDPRPLLLRRLGWLTAAGMLALVSMLGVGLALGADDLPETGLAWPTLLFAFLDGAIAVTGTVWFVTWFRGRRHTHGPLLGKAARASYATYVLHPLVLTVLMLAFAAVGLAPEIKFVLVAPAAVPLCFVVGYALTRVPGVSKVL